MSTAVAEKVNEGVAVNQHVAFISGPDMVGYSDGEERLQIVRTY